MSLSPDDGPVLATERRAHALLESALAVATGKEKRAAHRLGRLIADDDGSELLLELTDQVLRIRDPRRAARRLRDLVTASLPASRSTPPRSPPGSPDPSLNCNSPGTAPGWRW